MYIEKLLSFVIPCYRSEKTISKVIDEIIATVSLRPEWDYEIICVNDCSPDGVYNILLSLADKNKKIKIVNFAKNMGKHAAVLAGYSVCRGEYTVTLDDDCQCPANELWKLIEPLERDECDVATASYPVKKESLLKRLGSDFNNIIAAIMIGKPKTLRFENFTAQKYFITKEMISYTNPYPFIDGLILRITRRIKMVTMEERVRGDDNKTGFTFRKSFSLFANGFTSFSVKPLRIATFMGLGIAALGFLYSLFIIIRKVLHPEIFAGYSSLMCALLFIGGMLMMMLGVVGEYIGRIYICINKSPQYVIRNTVNIEELEH